jgi:hypothetical protein
MADVQKFSERVIDLAERISAVADAAQGKRVRQRGMRHAGSCSLVPALVSMHS